MKPPSKAPPRQTGEMKIELTVLCRYDGRIIAGNVDSIGTIAELAKRIECEDLQSGFEEFAGAGGASDTFVLKNAATAYRGTARKIADSQGEPLILIILSPLESAEDEAALAEAGRLTSRLIHDFKNQMGGLKLYAAYLKKRFSDNAEGLEIAEKIVQGLNSMADNAALVSKLTRPLELHLESNEIGAIIDQAIGDHQAQADARKIRIESRLESGIERPVDAQQFRLALATIICRAAETTPEGGKIAIRLQSQEAHAIIEIVDEGGVLSEQQLGSLFDFVSNERISKASLDLAFARRIIEKHGGEITAIGTPTGVVARIKLP